MHLDAQDELGFAEILDAVLAFEAVFDLLDLPHSFLPDFPASLRRSLSSLPSL
jgi:hypothetical protein